MNTIYNMMLFLSDITVKNTTEGISSGAATNSVVVPEGPDLFVVVQNLLNVTFAVVGIIAVIMIIIGGFYYMTSQGEPERVQKGKNTILYGIIGLIICLSAFAIVNFVLASLNSAK